MASNRNYAGPQDLPETIPVFPLPGALLLPRGQMPLNVFEPRYLQMVDDALKGERLIGMIQPLPESNATTAPSLYAIGCVGRITELAETGDGRYMITLTGITRFRLLEEQIVTTPYRQCHVDYASFSDDFQARIGEEAVDREALLEALRQFSDAKLVEIDWDSVDQAPTEALVNALSMMSPYEVAEKQALLEAPDLKTRADLLIAITEIELARREGDGELTVQ